MGLESDFEQARATKALRKRIGALLADPQPASELKKLYKIRSHYFHGRANMEPITGEERHLARSLARRVAEELLKAARENPSVEREVFLRNFYP